MQTISLDGRWLDLAQVLRVDHLFTTTRATLLDGTTVTVSGNAAHTLHDAWQARQARLRREAGRTVA